MKSLPVGIQNIRDIIQQDFTYVDKTSILYELIKRKGLYFLSRPRRFGKSLTCSTLEAIFRGDKELFDGLSISYTNYDWKSYPIIRLDFSSIDHETLDTLKAFSRKTIRIYRTRIWVRFKKTRISKRRTFLFDCRTGCPTWSRCYHHR